MMNGLAGGGGGHGGYGPSTFSGASVAGFTGSFLCDLPEEFNSSMDDDMMADINLEAIAECLNLNEIPLDDLLNNDNQ